MTTASFFEVPEHDQLVSTHARLTHAILATRSSGDTRSLIALLTMMAELSVNYWPPDEDGRQYRDALCTEAISLIEQTGFDEYLALALRLLASARPVDDGVALLRRALECARKRADKAETSRCLLALGNLCKLKGDVVGGTRSSEEGLELARELENDDALLAYALYMTALASDRKAATKRALYSEAVGICVRNRRYSKAGALLRACAFLACEDDAREQKKTAAAACEMFALDGNIDDERFSLQQLLEICDENVDADLKSYCEDRLRHLPTHDNQPVDGVGIEHLQRLHDALHNERGSQADELHAAAWAILQAARQ